MACCDCGLVFKERHVGQECPERQGKKPIGWEGTFTTPEPREPSKKRSRARSKKSIGEFSI